MTIRASKEILTKIAERGISMKEVSQCFQNVEHGYLEDGRPEHATKPPTKWFVAETDTGKLLKIMFVPRTDGVDLKSAYLATDNIDRIYKKFTAE